MNRWEEKTGYTSGRYRASSDVGDPPPPLDNGFRSIYEEFPRRPPEPPRPTAPEGGSSHRFLIGIIVAMLALTAAMLALVIAQSSRQSEFDATMVRTRADLEEMRSSVTRDIKEIVELLAQHGKAISETGKSLEKERLELADVKRRLDSLGAALQSTPKDLAVERSTRTEQFEGIERSIRQLFIELSVPERDQ